MRWWHIRRCGRDVSSRLHEGRRRRWADAKGIHGRRASAANADEPDRSVASRAFVARAETRLRNTKIDQGIPVAALGFRVIETIRDTHTCSTSSVSAATVANRSLRIIRVRDSVYVTWYGPREGNRIAVRRAGLMRLDSW